MKVMGVVGDDPFLPPWLSSEIIQRSNQNSNFSFTKLICLNYCMRIKY
jgi:hypothetical protein